MISFSTVGAVLCPMCFAGTVPPELVRLGALKEFDLRNNRFSGETYAQVIRIYARPWCSSESIHRVAQHVIV